MVITSVPLTNALFVMLVAFICLGLSASESGLLSNGSFEKLDPTGTPQDWSAEVDTSESGKARCLMDEKVLRHGKRSLRMDVTGPGRASAVSKKIEVTPNGRYLFSMLYRGKGFSDGTGYQGVNSFVHIYWYDGNQRSLGAPYQTQPWGRMIRLLRAPQNAVYAIVNIHLSAHKDGTVPTSIWVDDVRFRPWQTREGEGRAWKWSIFKVKKHNSKFSVVSDEDAANGRAVIARAGIHPEGLYPCGGFYRKDIPAGVYRVLFRLKTDATEGAESVAQLDVNSEGFVNSTLAIRVLTPSDFRKKNEYQEFALDFPWPPGNWVDFRVRWKGGASLWVDTVSVVELDLEEPDMFRDLVRKD